LGSRRHAVDVAVQLVADRDQDGSIVRHESQRNDVLRRVDGPARRQHSSSRVGLEAVQRAIRTDGDERVDLARYRLEATRDAWLRAMQRGRTESQPAGICWAGRGSRGAELVELRVEAHDAPSAAEGAIGGRVGSDRGVHPAVAEHRLAAILRGSADVREARERWNVGSGVGMGTYASRVHIDAHNRGGRVMVREIDLADLRRE